MIAIEILQTTSSTEVVRQARQKTIIKLILRNLLDQNTNSKFIKMPNSTNYEFKKQKKRTKISVNKNFFKI